MHAGFSGKVTFSGLQPGLYVLKIHAYNRRDDARTVKRGFVVTSDPDYCSLVLVNEGLRVSESGGEAVVEVKGHGPAEGFSCVLDSGEQFSCESDACPYMVSESGACPYMVCESGTRPYIVCMSLVHAHIVCESGAYPYMVCESGACPYIVCVSLVHAHI